MRSRGDNRPTAPLCNHKALEVSLPIVDSMQALLIASESPASNSSASASSHACLYERKNDLMSRCILLGSCANFGRLPNRDKAIYTSMSSARAESQSSFPVTFLIRANALFKEPNVLTTSGARSNSSSSGKRPRDNTVSIKDLVLSETGPQLLRDFVAPLPGCHDPQNHKKMLANPIQKHRIRICAVDSKVNAVDGGLIVHCCEFLLSSSQTAVAAV